MAASLATLDSLSFRLDVLLEIDFGRPPGPESDYPDWVYDYDDQHLSSDTVSGQNVLRQLEFYDINIYFMRWRTYFGDDEKDEATLTVRDDEKLDGSKCPVRCYQPNEGNFRSTDYTFTWSYKLIFTGSCRAIRALEDYLGTVLE